MANGLNKVTIIGNVGRTPEMKFTPSGKAVTSFSVGVTAYPDKDTEWFNCVAWEKRAEALAQVEKGAKLHITGRLKTRSWDAPDGTKKFKTELIVEDFLFLDKKQTAPAPAAEAADEVDWNTGVEASDDLPF